MLTKYLVLASTILGLMASGTTASERYKVRAPVILDQSLTQPWILQLQGPSSRTVFAPVRMGGNRQINLRRVTQQRNVVAQPVAYRANKPVKTRLEPQFLPQVVDYASKHKPGTIIIDTNNRFLYLIGPKGTARRYGVGVGKPGFEWAGAHRVTRKAEWPGWTPPKEMIKREAAKGHFLPAHMAGGEDNPLGARAMYLGSSIYRIHGTNAPWTIGFAVSSGCIRMRNEDVVDLYDRVKVGARVIVM